MAVISGNDADSRLAGSSGADSICVAGDGDVLLRRERSGRLFRADTHDAIYGDNGGAALNGGPGNAPLRPWRGLALFDQSEAIAIPTPDDIVLV